MFDTTAVECPPDELLAVFADGGLRGRERHDVSAHLLGCGACYVVFRELARDRLEATVPPELIRTPLVPLG